MHQIENNKGTPKIKIFNKLHEFYVILFLHSRV